VSNLRPAIERALGRLTIERGIGGGTDQVCIRLSPKMKRSWEEAASGYGMTLAHYIRTICDSHSQTVLSCTHPSEYIHTYHSHKFCLRCGLEVRGDGVGGAQA
jgi:hypothetical protein